MTPSYVTAARIVQGVLSFVSSDKLDIERRFTEAIAGVLDQQQEDKDRYRTALITISKHAPCTHNPLSHRHHMCARNVASIALEKDT